MDEVKPGLTYKNSGRLRWVLNSKLPRHTELRWCGKNVQWVLSPVQVAVWTDWQNRHPERHPHLPYNWRINWCPVARSY